MMENNKEFDSVASEWLKKLPLDEPSDNFSLNVMQSVYALESNKEKGGFNYWWLLALIPVLAGLGWYLSSAPAFSEYFSSIWDSFQDYYNSLNVSFGEKVGSVKNISISPLVILGFLAILSLLVIEDIFKSKHTKVNAE